MDDTKGFVSIVGAVASCAALGVTFIPHLRPYVNMTVAPVGTVWAMVAVFPRFSDTFNFSKRSFLSAIVSAGFAVAIVAVSHEMRLAAFVISFPFPFFYAISDPSCRTPLEQMLNPLVSGVVHYGIVAFGPPDLPGCVNFAAQLVGCLTVGPLCACLSHMFFTVLFRRRQSFCAADVHGALQVCLDVLLHSIEGVTTYCFTGDVHEEELRKRLKNLKNSIATYEASVKAWNAEWWSEKPPAEALGALQSRLVDSHALLSGLLESFGTGYSQMHKALILDPVAIELEDMRLSTVAAMRSICEWVSCSDDDGSGEAAVKAQTWTKAAAQASERFASASHEQRRRLLAQARVASHFGELSAMDTVRAAFALYTLRHVSSVVVDLHQALEDAGVAQIGLRPLMPARICGNICGELRVFCADIRKPSKYFASLPADEILDGSVAIPLRYRARRLLKYPLRLTLSCYCMVLVLLWVVWRVPSAEPYAFWAMLPSVVCFLPTTGAALRKSSRRLLGTLAGGLLALGCVAWNNSDAPAIFAQLAIVSFSAKYMSTFASIDYAGVTFALTWHIVVLGSWDVERSVSIDIALWRILMTSAGVLGTVIFSLALMPSHATTAFERQSAEAALSTTEACLVASHALVADALGPFDSTDIANRTSVAAVAHYSPVELETTVRSSLAGRTALLVDAEAERWVVPRVVRKLGSLQESLERLADLAAAIRFDAAALDRRAAPGSDSRDGDGHSVAGALSVDGSNEASGGVDARGFGGKASSSVAADSEVRSETAPGPGAPSDFGPVRQFVLLAPLSGRKVAHDLAKLQEILRQSALGIALQLRGVRAPQSFAAFSTFGEHALRRALRSLEQSFASARVELFAGQAVAIQSIVSEDLNAFYACIYGLFRYTEHWLELIAILAKDQSTSSGRRGRDSAISRLFGRSSSTVGDGAEVPRLPSQSSSQLSQVPAEFGRDIAGLPLSPRSRLPDLHGTAARDGTESDCELGQKPEQGRSPSGSDSSSPSRSSSSSLDSRPPGLLGLWRGCFAGTGASLGSSALD